MKNCRLLKILKRASCVLLSAVFVFLSPIQAYVASASVTLTAGTYAVLAILAACGVLATSETFQALIGSWTSEAEYLVKGAQRQLGTYAQRIYDNARNGDIGIQEKFALLEMALIRAVCCNWDDTITGMEALSEDLKEFLKSCIGLTNEGAFIQVPAIPAEEIWGATEWSSQEKYPLPSGVVMSPFFVSDSNYTFFLTVYALSNYGSQTMNIQNWYYANTLDIFGVYDSSLQKLNLYKRDAEHSRYASYSAFTFSAYVNSDGTLKYKTDSMSYWQRDWVLCSPADAGELSFPVFTSIADAEHYVSTGEALNTYVSGTVSVALDGYRTDVMDLVKGCIADVFTIPSSSEVASEKLGVIADVYPAGTVEDIKEAVKAGGLAIGDGADVPVTGDITLSDIVTHILSLPASIAKAIADAFSLTGEEAQEQLSVPEIISSKFPFCIPFDFAYLISILAAEPEAPKFVFPFRFDYDQFHISYDFVIDLSSWEQLASMIRVLMDILFCASLMLGTRSLIRG